MNIIIAVLVLTTIISFAGLSFYYYISRKAKAEVRAMKEKVDVRAEELVLEEIRISGIRNHNEMLLFSMKEQATSMYLQHSAIDTLLDRIREWDGDPEDWNKISKWNHTCQVSVEKFFYNSFKRTIVGYIDETNNTSNNGFSLN